MTPATRHTLMFLLAVLPTAGYAAGKYSWFDDTSSEPSAVPMRPSAFGADVYRSAPDPAAPAGLTKDTKVSVYGDYAPRSALTAGDTDKRANRFANFGVRWQQRLSPQNQLAVSAEQGDGVSWRTLATNTTGSLDTRATISWRHESAASWKPSITGGVFLGDESSRDETLRQFGRRYYGFSVGGELRILNTHTPYVSFRMERSLYGLQDSGGMGSSNLAGSGPSMLRTTDDSSRLAAGWRWQVQRGWSVQAEASYGFNLDNSSDILPQDRERSRLFFGTRFDFR